MHVLIDVPVPSMREHFGECEGKFLLTSWDLGDGSMLEPPKCVQGPVSSVICHGFVMGPNENVLGLN